MALTLADLKTLDAFNSNAYEVFVRLNSETNQWFVAIVVGSRELLIGTHTTGKVRYTRNLPHLLAEIFEFCNNAKSITIELNNMKFKYTEDELCNSKPPFPPLL